MFKGNGLISTILWKGSGKLFTLLFLLTLMLTAPSGAKAGGLLLYDNGCGNQPGDPNPCIRTLTCDIQGTNYPTTVYGYKDETPRKQGAVLKPCDHSSSRSIAKPVRTRKSSWRA